MGAPTLIESSQTQGKRSLIFAKAGSMANTQLGLVWLVPGCRAKLMNINDLLVNLNGDWGEDYVRRPLEYARYRYIRASFEAKSRQQSKYRPIRIPPAPSKSVIDKKGHVEGQMKPSNAVVYGCAKAQGSM
ncbi:hypothetical protein CISG_04817 [Coccidioides immitis RMSCC 3703]|uniref:Uncharacterized protein n=2 Tax=Coccidioides immitis TaxID=5501 RepID=A0A0J8QWE1_COCIT|nr:hypothetical protein CIRG_08831 [Coccidioides immitis RMSCC 2394]KMU75643.1 hypothetical protein CISG_04817 [Coccidioides immitis RMSCC 3703]